MKKTDMPDFDLEKELAQPTEEANEVEDLDTPEAEIDQDDFADGFEELDLDEDEEAPEPKPFNARNIAYRLVRSFNIIQKSVLKSLYKKNVLQEGDQEAAKKMHAQQKAGKAVDIPEYGTPQYEQLQRIDKFMKLCEEAPLTEEEMQDLTDPFAELVEKHNFLQMGPEGALALAIFTIMLPRIEPLFPSIGKIFNKAKA